MAKANNTNKVNKVSKGMGMMIFITNDSIELKVFIRQTINSKLLKFIYMTKTEKILLNHKNHGIHIVISEIKSVDNFVIGLYINKIIVGKFRTNGIKSSDATNGLCKTIVFTRHGKIFLEFETAAV